MESKLLQNTSSSESYNGAMRDGYSWSQTLREVDAYINVPSNVTKGKQLRVVTDAKNIEVCVATVDPETNASVWKMLVKGELTWKVDKLETLWSLVPGKHVAIHLDKCEERWWEALLEGEAKIDTRLINAERPMDELAQEEQMKIAELMWQDEQKKKGIPVTGSASAPGIGNRNLQDVLKEAWDMEGSPFKGQPFDPSSVQFQDSLPEFLKRS